jgi:hypothetical protein
MPQQQRKKWVGSLSVIALLSMTVAGQVSADMDQDIENALNFNNNGKSGAVKFDLSYRWENVNEDNKLNAAGAPLAIQPQTANASTARLRLGYLTPVFHAFQAYAEYAGTLAMQDEYNNTLPNGNPQYSKVADPDRSELNQFWLSYAGIANTLIKGGRQRFSLDDQRFIGNVPWRQFEQTFESVLITHDNKALGLLVNAGYIGSVQTPIGVTDDLAAPLLNINYKMGNYGNMTGYGYWLDFTEAANYEKSSQTYGLRASCCAKPLDSIKLSDNFGVVYTAEWSHQSDYGSGKVAYDADRYNVMSGFSAYNIMFQGAMEQLGGSGLNKTFDTPLGTNHAFQGWADLFTTTPVNGIRDVFGTVMVPIKAADVVLTGVYHDYSDDTGRFNYGNEWNFLATKKFGKHYTLLAKYAYYTAGSNNDPGFLSTNTQKIWLQGNINF